MYKVTACWKCKAGGERAPLIKITKLDYAHSECFQLHGIPKIQNCSYVFKKTPKELKQELIDKLGVQLKKKAK